MLELKSSKAGLKSSPRKAAIAEDLVRDERRFPEAAEMFEISVREGPASYFIYGELAGCYEEIGNYELAEKYRNMFDNP